MFDPRLEGAGTMSVVQRAPGTVSHPSSYCFPFSEWFPARPFLLFPLNVDLHLFSSNISNVLLIHMTIGLLSF